MSKLIHRTLESAEAFFDLVLAHPPGPPSSSLRRVRVEPRSWRGRSSRARAPNVTAGRASHAWASGIEGTPKATDGRLLACERGDREVRERRARWRPGDAHAVAQAPAWPEAEPLTIERCRAVFDEAPPFTLGLEEELMLVEPGSLALAPVNDAVLALFDDDSPYRKEGDAARARHARLRDRRGGVRGARGRGSRESFPW
jgi:hypothetical protein